jgi:hypothetical protein
MRVDVGIRTSDFGDTVWSGICESVGGRRDGEGRGGLNMAAGDSMHFVCSRGHQRAGPQNVSESSKRNPFVRCWFEVRHSVLG